MIINIKYSDSQFVLYIHNAKIILDSDSSTKSEYILSSQQMPPQLKYGSLKS